MTELEQKLLKALKASLEFEWVGQGAKARMEEAERIVMDAEAAKPVADADGWIPWAGGDCPVSQYQRIHVRYRCGIESAYEIPAGVYGWRHNLNGGDIIAYRVVGDSQ